MTLLDYVVLSVALYFANIVVQAVFGNMRYDPKTLLGPRDDFAPEGLYLMRAKRAQANFTEAMAMFVPLALIAHLTDKSAGLATLGAAVFFWARLAYLIVYVAGAPVVRSLVWTVGVIGVLMVFRAVAPF